MLMVIFGAGASFDSIPHDPASQQAPMFPHQFHYRPPLATHLFDNRANFVKIMDDYEACKDIVPFLRDFRDDESIEDTLSELDADVNHNPDRHAQMVAVSYYLRDVLRECEEKWLETHHNITNYRSLVDLIVNLRASFNDQVCFVTFNYDTMLERALQWRKLMNVPTHLGEYIAHHSYKVFKLHGSVNWGRVPARCVPEEADAYKYFASTPDAEIGEIYSLYENMKLFPAMAIPLKNKRGYECPLNHVEEFKKCLPKVNKVVTIGWKATEQHFLKDLSKGLPLGASMLIVSANAYWAEVTRKNLIQGIPSMELGFDTKLSDGGFTELVKSKQLAEFLKS